MNTAEKLTLLADHLETIPARKIRLEDWKCATAACAVGHACTIPEFQEMGLVVEIGVFKNHPVFGRYGGWAAVEAFFGINGLYSSHLFDANSYTSAQLANPKRHVIKRLRKFVANQVQP